MGFWYHHFQTLQLLDGKLNFGLKFSQNFLLRANKWDSSVSFPGRKWGFSDFQAILSSAGPECQKFSWEVHLGLLTCIIRFAISAVLAVGDYWKILHSLLVSVILAFKTALSFCAFPFLLRASQTNVLKRHSRFRSRNSSYWLNASNQRLHLPQT